MINFNITKLNCHLSISLCHLSISLCHLSISLCHLSMPFCQPLCTILSTTLCHSVNHSVPFCQPLCAILSTTLYHSVDCYHSVKPLCWPLCTIPSIVTILSTRAAQNYNAFKYDFLKDNQHINNLRGLNLRIIIYVWNINKFKLNIILF